MEKILEADMFIGADHRLIVELPPEVTCKLVKVTVEETETAPGPKTKFERPIGLALGRAVIHPSFFDPLPEDELRLWEGYEEP